MLDPPVCELNRETDCYDGGWFMTAVDSKAQLLLTPNLLTNVSSHPCIPTQSSEIYSDHPPDRDDGSAVLSARFGVPQHSNL